MSLAPALQSSTFSDPDPDDFHTASQWQITVSSGDYSTPVFDSGIDTQNLTQVVVPSGKLEYGTTYYWHVKHQDNNGAWSKWSNETSFTTEAIEILITKLDNILPGVSMLFSNKGTETHVVTFEILDKDSNVPTVGYHKTMLPVFLKASERSFELPPGTYGDARIIFDPLTSEDLGTLTSIKIRVTYSNIDRLVEMHYPQHIGILATPFNMSIDAYSFSNTDWLDEGKCYGMAATSILYFTGELALPNNKPTTYSLTKEEAVSEGYIKYYQDDWWFNKWPSLKLGYSDNKLGIDEYVELKEYILKKEPMIFLMKGFVEGEKSIHAVVVYKIVEDLDKSYIIIYDNNNPYDPDGLFPINTAFQYITYDRNTQELDYKGYTKFELVRAMKDHWYENIKILGAGELRVYDSHGWITGMVMDSTGL